MDDIKQLTDLNLRFIDAFRKGSWEILQPILSPSFSYLDGATGEVWTQQRYIEDLRSDPLPTIGIGASRGPAGTAATSTRTSGARTAGSASTPAFGRCNSGSGGSR